MRIRHKACDFTQTFKVIVRNRPHYLRVCSDCGMTQLGHIPQRRRIPQTTQRQLAAA
jgi:hypothetical protein